MNKQEKLLCEKSGASRVVKVRSTVYFHFNMDSDALVTEKAVISAFGRKYHAIRKNSVDNYARERVIVVSTQKALF